MEIEWKTIEKGYIGSLIVEKAFLKNGFNLFKPVLENGKVDLIVEKDNKYFKLQIKTVQNNKIPFRKISHNMGEYKIKYYTKEDIDYFVGVDIETENIYILPVSFSSQFKSSVAISKCSVYCNNFKLEPASGNINSGDDDNGKSLTDNADGNSVGTE